MSVPNKTTTVKTKHISERHEMLKAVILPLLISLPIAAQSKQHKSTSDASLTKNSIYVEEAHRSIISLNTHWLADSAGATTWTGINAWQRFVIADSLMKYIEVSGDRGLISDVEDAVANKDGLDGNDDDLWDVIASLNLYKLNRSPQLLQSAEETYKRLVDNYWDDTCGGGIWWDHDRSYKNAITNELLLYASTLLYRETSDRSYYTWSFREWNWFNHSGLINDRWLINDGLDKHCSNNKEKTYTYNQGVILGALVGLYSMDKDSSHLTVATKIAEAITTNLSNTQGILVEPVEPLGQDGQIFKGIFLYHLGSLFQRIEDQKDRRVIANFIFRNADSAWHHREISDDKINAYWDNAHALYGAAAQSAGISLFEAAAIASRPHK